MAEPQIKVIGNLGDATPLDYGGFIVYETKTGERKSIEAEYWPEPESRKERYGESQDYYEIDRFTVEDDVLKDLSWVKDWDGIAETMGTSEAEIKKLARSKNPLDRAEVYRMVGDYSGWENIDGYPITLSRKEMEERWPEFK